VEPKFPWQSGAKEAKETPQKFKGQRLEPKQDERPMIRPKTLGQALREWLAGFDWQKWAEAGRHWFFGTPQPWPAGWRERATVLVERVTKKGWATLAGLIFAVALVFGFAVSASWGTPVTQQATADTEATIYYTLRPGLSAREIADELIARGVLTDKWGFWWQARVKGQAADFKTGTYALQAHMTADELVQKFVSGQTTRVKFTIPEGFSVKEIAKRLAAEGIVDEQEFLRKAQHFAPYDYIERKPEADYYCEGFLFPDTYTLEDQLDVDTILKLMARDFDERLTPALRDRAEEMHLSIFDLVTLASLVEKECRYPEDRPIVAQVFFKRLRLGMPLQTDTTLQYLLDSPKEDVSIKDTQMESPYNTYQHKGLPPGPIANPGMASIEAVLQPAATEYLYFVADRQGHNHYATSYQEHMDNVNRYR